MRSRAGRALAVLATLSLAVVAALLLATAPLEMQRPALAAGSVAAVEARSTTSGLSAPRDAPAPDGIPVSARSEAPEPAAVAASDARLATLRGRLVTGLREPIEGLSLELVPLRTGHDRTGRRRKPLEKPLAGSSFSAEVEPGEWEVRVLALGSESPVFASSPLALAPGEPAQPRELDGIDLRGRVREVSWRAVDAARGTVVEGATAVAAGSRRLRPRTPYAIGSESLRVFVVAEGYVSADVALDGPATEARLHRPGNVGIEVPPGLFSAEGVDVRIVLRLVRLDAVTGDRRASRAGETTVELDGGAGTFELRAAGEYSVTLRVRYSFPERQGVASLAGEPVRIGPEHIGRVIAVRPREPRDEAWLATLR